jgi:hypothetical protein
VTGASERGGAAILVAFLLLTLMAAAVFATSRNLIRDQAMGGEALQGTLAACAAEAGLAWFLAQAAGNPGGVAGVPAGRAPEGLLAGSSDGAFEQDFDLRIRDLGLLPRPEGDDQDASERLWRVTALGRSALKGQEETGCNQVRELLVAEARERPGELRILAWMTLFPIFPTVPVQ